jgi:hypothetical protein
MGILSKIPVPKLPDRTVIFLSALYFWTYIMCYMAKFVHVSLSFILRHTPDAFIIHKSGGTLTTSLVEVIDETTEQPLGVDGNEPKRVSKKMLTRVNIIQAMADCIPITNKIKNVIHSNWDNEIGADSDGKHPGGINVRDILSFVKSPVVWISYLFEVDKKLSDMSDAEIGKAIKTVLIDFGDKALYRDSEMKKKEPMLFGEIPF